jgi:tetratricopeptide (TPR) repeat protein
MVHRTETPGAPQDRPTAARWCLVPLVAAVAIYLPALANEFLVDDIHVVAGNPLVCGDALDAARILGSDYWAGVLQNDDTLYRPLTILLHAATCQAAGPDPAFHRAVSLVFHGLNAVLLFFLLRRLLPPGRRGWAGSVLGSVAFAVHPLNSEAVLFVANRSDLVAAASCLGVALLVLAYVFRRVPTGRVDRTGGATLFAIAAVQAVGVFSKESAVAAPVVAGMVTLLAWRLMPAPSRGRFPWAQTALALAPAAVAIAAYLAARVVVLGALYHGAGFAPLDNPLVLVPSVVRVRTAIEVLGRYLGLFVAPIHLSADYSLAQILPVTSWLAPGFLAGAAACLALVAAGLLALRRLPIVTLGVAWYLVALFPASNLAFPIGTIMGERLTYLPDIGLFIALAGAGVAVVSRLSPRVTRGFVLAVVAVVVELAVLTGLRGQETATNCGLFDRTAEASPDSAKAQFGVGICAREKDDMTRAITAFDRALRLYPDYGDAMVQVAQALERAGYIQEAIDRLGTFLETHPTATGVRFTLAKVLARDGRRDQARAVLATLIQRFPGRADFQEALRHLDEP